MTNEPTPRLPSRFGVHAPLAGGLMKAFQWGMDAGCNCLQIFSGNPNAWRAAPWKEADADAFRAARAEGDMRPCILHTPYLINLASPDDSNWDRSRRMLQDALDQARRTGSEFVNSHIGSHKGAGMVRGIQRVAEALAGVLEEDETEACVLLETTNGSGNLVGSRFEDLAAVLDLLAPHPRALERTFICLDTAHVWAAGYDLSTADATRAVLDEFDSVVGLDRLLCIHANDNKRELGGRSDVHEDIGEGRIGPDAFRTLVNEHRLAHVAFILETPKDSPADDRRNLDVIRGYQSADRRGLTR